MVRCGMQRTEYSVLYCHGDAPGLRFSLLFSSHLLSAGPIVLYASCSASLQLRGSLVYL